MECPPLSGVSGRCVRVTPRRGKCSWIKNAFALSPNVKVPCGEEHPVRKRIAKQTIKCAQGGRTTLIELTDAGQSAFGRIGRGRKIAALAGTQTAR